MLAGPPVNSKGQVQNLKTEVRRPNIECQHAKMAFDTAGQIVHTKTGQVLSPKLQGGQVKSQFDLPTWQTQTHGDTDAVSAYRRRP